MVLTANGALAGPDGLSRSISGPADRAVLSATRAWADAILVGAGTVRTEKYQPVRERIGAQRLAAGRLAAPRLVILTRSGNLDWDDPLFCDSAVPPLIVATADCQQLPGHVEQIRSPGPEVDLGALVSQLWDLRLERITCEGGPSLLADMIGAGTIDEMDVTIAPHLVGPTGRPTGSPQNPGSSSPAPVTRAPALTGLTIAGLACKDDYIFARYLRRS
jgi:riboflavin biosynthesis pyrimidine reductase